MVGHFDHQADARDAAPPQSPQRALHQRRRRAPAARRGVHRYRDQFRPLPADAGDHIPLDFPVVLRNQKQLPASLEKLCEQLVIVCLIAETGALDLQNAVQVREAQPPNRVSRVHSAIPKKWWGYLDKHFGLRHTKIKMQMSGNNGQAETSFSTLLDLRRGDAATLDHIDLPGDAARRLMELGFLPGIRITAGHSAPGGDPRVFQVDGSEIALRRETARRLKVRLDKTSQASGMP
jgi:ferrous iron transport protein A